MSLHLTFLEKLPPAPSLLPSREKMPPAPSLLPSREKLPPAPSLLPSREKVAAGRMRGQSHRVGLCSVSHGPRPETSTNTRTNHSGRPQAPHETNR